MGGAVLKTKSCIFIIIAAALWGGRISALPAGEGEASVRLAVHLPLEIRQTHSPSPVRVRGSLGWISRTTPRAAVLVQS